MTPPSPDSGPTHPGNNFDFVRLAAALFVLVSHQHALMGLPEPSIRGVQSLGGLGVMVFFVISGFLVAQSWNADPHLGRFAARRLLRVWPGLAVVILLSVALLGPAVSTLALSDYFAHPWTREYLKNLHFTTRFQLPLHFDGSTLPTSVNGSLWTIPLELKCYLLMALAAMGGLLRARWVLLAALAGTAAIYLGPAPAAQGWSAAFHWQQERRFLLEFGLYFFAGTALQAFRIQDSAARTGVAVVLVWALAAAAWAAGLQLLALWLALPATVVALANAATPGLRAAGRFGDLSYGIYIYAFPVQQTLIWSLRDRMPWSALLLLTLAITLAFAFASWHLVEKRALRLKPRRRAPSRSAPAAMWRSWGTRTPPRATPGS